MNKLLIGVAVLTVVVLGIGSFLAWKMLSKIDQTPPASIAPQISKTPTPEKSKTKRIAYVKDKRVWIVDETGENRKAISGGTGVYNDEYFPDLAWKNNNIISYINCFPICKIFTYNLSNSQTLDEVTAKKDVQILTLNWNHEGNKLAYLYKLPDGQMKLNLKTGEIDNTIKNFFAGPGRGGSLDDDVSIHFSPDDKQILVTNTLTVGNPQDKNTIWILDSETGKELGTLSISTISGWPTQATWLNNDTIMFKTSGDNGLYQFKITDKGMNLPSTTINASFYNPITSGEGTNYYWATTKNPKKSGASYQGPPFISSSDKQEKIILSSAYKPKSFGWKNLVYLKSKQLDGSEEQIFDFISNGLATMNILENKEVILDTGEINLFEVSP